MSTLGRAFLIAVFPVFCAGVAPAQTVSFTLSEASAAPGEAATVEASVSGFEDVTTAQFSIDWDPAIAAFSSVENFNLPGLDGGNFGTPDDVGDGTLTFSWDDPDAQGVTVSDGTVIFELQLQAVGAAGEQTVLSFTDDPTAREVTVNLQTVNFDGTNGSVTVNALPNVSNVVLSNDGADNLAFSFETNEQLGSDGSDIAVSVDGPNTNDVYSFDRSDFSESGSGPYTYDLTTTQAYDDGTGTYTASVDDAVDPDGGDGADGTQKDSYAFEADVTLTDGNDGEAYDPPSANPGTDNNPVGRFKLSADVEGASLSSVTITQEGSSPNGVNTIGLWESDDDTFESGTDEEIATKDYANSVTFSDLGVSISPGGGYVFVVMDLSEGAGGDYWPKITDESDIGFDQGGLSNINGTETTSFTDAYLSSEATALPVELAKFDAVVSGNEVVLSWRTASEQNNAGFRVQRKIEGKSGEWTTIGRRSGRGTTTEAQRYRFTDADLPYEADRLTYRLKQVDINGFSNLSETVAVVRGVSEVELLGTYPNPVRSRATVRYAVPEKQHVTIRLYDMLGRQVRMIVQAEQEGRHEQVLDTSALPSGTYLLRLRAMGEARTQKLTVLQ